ncbi:MAG TPA: WYL domain-containing protein, partial [Polyangiales bacterium]|nr:WYL domain-containing protein [Polyangiales bacterium]
RDLDALRDAEFPLNSERGRGGGVAHDRSYTLPPVNFSAREAALIIAACEWLARMKILPFAETLNSALDKVRAALSASAQRRLIEHLETLEFVGVPARTCTPAVQRVVERAWFEGADLRIDYAGSHGMTTRRVRLHTVVMERGETLLNCIDLDKSEPRQFKLDRIKTASVLTDTGHSRQSAARLTR